MSAEPIAKEIADDVLAIVGHLGIPAVSLGADVLKLLVDGGYAALFRGARHALEDQRRAQTAGVAAASSSAATEARAHAEQAPAGPRIRNAQG